MLWSAYARHADHRDRERARQRRQKAVSAFAAELRRTSWLEWLRDHAAQGDSDALAALRSRDRRRHLTPSALHGDGAASSRALPAPVDSVTVAGTVVYRVQGCSIRDDGTRLYLTGATVSASAAETLLRAAYDRFGSRLGIDGDEAFRARMLAAAISSGLPITFADEQLERRRVALQHTQPAVWDGGVTLADTTSSSRAGRARHMR